MKPVLNRQNDRIIAADISTANESARIVGRNGHPKALIVWVAVTSDGKSNLVFIDQGVKINSNAYLNDVLIKELHPWIHSHFGGRPYIFQHDGASAHKARCVQDWYKNNLNDFIQLQEAKTERLGAVGCLNYSLVVLPRGCLLLWWRISICFAACFSGLSYYLCLFSSVLSAQSAFFSLFSFSRDQVRSFCLHLAFVFVVCSALPQFGGRSVH